MNDVQPEVDGDVKHGTQYAYRKGCRCDVCRQGKAEEFRRYRASERGQVSERAYRKALMRVRDAHREEFDRYLEEERNR